MASPRNTTGRIVLLGGGGHALVVAEAAELDGWTIAGCLDDSPEPALVDGAPHAKRLGALHDEGRIGDRQWILALGDLGVRRDLLRTLEDRAGAATVEHPTAHVSPFAGLGAGVYIGPNAVVHTRATVGAHAILNSACVIEHDCRVGDNTHVAPGAVLGGTARVGPDTLVGLGARVLPGVTVGAGCVVAAGAVVAEDVPEGATVAGVPASTRPG